MILVTGSSGHLGEALMRHGRAQGRVMRGLDRVAAPWTDVVGDIADAGTVRAAMDGVRAVIHTATLHKPHVATHTPQAFVDTNISGTLALLQAAAEARVDGFVFTSTTSAFGRALSPAPGQPAAWIDETVGSVPKNIYGATKTGAEDLCQLYAVQERLPLLVLRVARFFPEPDDDPDKRAAYPDDNAKANEFLFRRLDLEDACAAHLLAVDQAARIGFDRLILSAPSPFQRADLAELRHAAPAVAARYVPDMPEIYARLGWRMFAGIDRVYDSRRAQNVLGWRPRYGFETVLRQAAAHDPIGSALSRDVGIKGYHGAHYADGLYPVC